jgi:cytochrome c oxidase cbb3-type subunit 2
VNRGPIIFLGAFLTFSFAWFGLVFTPYMQLLPTDPIQQEGGGSYPQPLIGDAARGVKVYQSMGCIYCHTQQVRPAPFTSDIERGWGGIGKRRTVPLDYINDRPVMLGTMRTGPDLANVGHRGDAVYQHKHLYNPRFLLKDSIMPAFRFLYEWENEENVRADERMLASELTGLELGEKAKARKIDGKDILYREDGKQLVPTDDARALVAYLTSLKRDAALPAPKPATPNP